MNIPDEAVEAAREALEDALGYGFDDPGTIRVVLEAAAPHMLADAWREGYMYSYDQERGGSGDLPIPVPEYLADDLVQWNPYRPTP